MSFFASATRLMSRHRLAVNMRAWISQAAIRITENRYEIADFCNTGAALLMKQVLDLLQPDAASLVQLLPFDATDDK